MTSEHLCIDPALPICWEDQDTLRIGFERAEARIPHPSAGVQRLVAALSDGLALVQTPRDLRRFGATPREWQELIERVAPVLVAAEPVAAESSAPIFSPPVRGDRVVVSGVGLGAQELRAALRLLGWEVLADRDPLVEGQDPDLLVVVERFLEPKSHSHLMLAERVPVLSITFTDRSVRIGPLAVPRSSPCPECVTQHQIEADPVVPVVAAQLCGRTPAAETIAAVRMTVTLTVGVLERWQHGGSELAGARLRLAVNNGLPALAPELQEVSPHPSCRCTAFSPLPVQPPIVRPASATKRDGVR